MPNVRSQYIFIPLYETANLCIALIGGIFRVWLEYLPARERCNWLTKDWVEDA